jgi:hypothetical protein
MYQIELQNKEHIIYWMLQHGNVRLSHYDHSFLSSMMQLVHEKKNITENQSNLLTRLITKYQHQLSVAGLKQKELHALDWQSTIIPSLPEFTSARVKYLKEENLLTIKVPFKKDFINTFRGDSMPYWEWNKEKKRYEATPSTTALKLAYKILPRYFDTIYYGEVKELIDELEKIGIANTIWNPTLVESNGEYSIAASNDTLDDLLKDTPLNTEPKTLCMLAQLGIAIDEEIIGNDPKMKFCSEYVTQVDIDDMATVATWIVELECKKVVLSRGLKSASLHHPETLSVEIIKHLENNQLSFIQSPMYEIETDFTITANAMVMQYSTLQQEVVSNRGALKNIQIINRRSISVK